MTQRSRIWDGNTGLGALGDAGPYSSANWRDIWKYNGLYDASGGGVLIGSGTPPDEGLIVSQSAVPAMSVKVSPGRANIQGGFFESDADVTLTIAANASGNPRIDSIILRMDFTAQTIRLAVLQGTPAATPAAPTLTQTAALWETSIADVDVANGAATITNQNIWGRFTYHNVSNALYHTNVQNRSGGTLRTGDIVTWSSGFDKAVTTTSTQGVPNLAGVWVGNTANLGYGRVLYQGIGYVRVTGTINSRLNAIIQSGTAKIGQHIVNSSTTPAVAYAGFAINLELTTFGAGNGLCLCYVNTGWNRSRSLPISPGSGGYAQLGNATTNSATFVDVLFGGTTALQTTVALGLNMGGFGGLLVSFSGVVAHSVPNRIDFDIGINGTNWAVTDLTAADGIITARPAAAGVAIGVAWTGLIPFSSGLVLASMVNTITLRWKTAAATATFMNANVAAQNYLATLTVTPIG